MPKSTMLASLGQIDWTRPWLASVSPIAQIILQKEDWRRALNETMAKMGVLNHAGHPICFVEQGALPVGMAYEKFISETGCVPTRNNLHDFFNALVWLSFPKIKCVLNLLQAQEIGRLERLHGGVSERGRQRDGATIFDENAVLLITADLALVESLRAHDWQACFVLGGESFHDRCELAMFGHALMEKLVHPYKAITGHTWVLYVEAAYLALPLAERQGYLDALVASQIAGGFGPSDFTPLPILGVPGWWAEQSPDFYSDEQVFRPKRSLFKKTSELPSTP